MSDPDMPDLSLCSFEYLAAEMRRRGATITPAPHGGDFQGAPKSTAEHIAADIRTGIFPRKSETK